jgi:hypothetical protein
MSIHRNLPPTGKEIFWGEIAPTEHLVQIYGDDVVFLDSLEGFVLAGLQKGEAVIMIGTPSHRRALETRLTNTELDVVRARNEDQYVPLDAEETLDSFMVSGWPDEERFQKVIAGILTRAGKGGRKVRAFGEMVALMWANGLHGATVRLEHLWHRLCHAHTFSLFCAYPQSCVTQDPHQSMREILTTHTQTIN